MAGQGAIRTAEDPFPYLALLTRTNGPSPAAHGVRTPLPDPIPPVQGHLWEVHTVRNSRHPK